jgi:hypothetical protein
MTQMEANLVRSLNSFFMEQKIKAFAFRQYQVKFGLGQVADILCDSLDKRFYSMIEAKSMDTSTGVKTFNFKSRFDESKEGFQLARENAFCELTGRKGILALELRNGVGKSRDCYFIPLCEVYDLWKSGEKSLKMKDIISYPKLKRKKSLYVVDDEIFNY